ncbi:MAG: DCC1-like thiol-disulfide oxidoreductase family protein [Planctomycetota bacterium]|nr:DCC1-like thiol-disulfide oxidoreductase family protein [Planctomycetota bacterium]
MAAQKEHWLFYDGTCRFCIGMVERWRRPLEQRGFGFAALQEDWVRNQLDLPEQELLQEMRVLSSSGRVRGAADALVFIWGRIWWCWPLWLIAQVPGVHWLLDQAYRWIAARRNCISGTCSVHAHSNTWRGGWTLVGWLPLATLVTVTACLRDDFAESWLFMWVLGFAMFAGCKWLTLWKAWTHGAVIGLRGSLGYLFLWPGMKVRPFTDEAKRAAKPGGAEWLAALLKTGSACAILWGVTPQAAGNPLLAGWCGMVGLILLLHFGSFHLLALAWQSVGVRAEPIMNAPTRAKSLSEFWSERWNLAFNDLAHSFLFSPAYRRIGVTGAVLLVFLVSGLVHDAIISLPANACYGRPTAYFLLQGVGVLFERSSVGRRMGLGRGAVGWLYMAVCILSPLPMLFHEPFVTGVIHPFLQVIGAL